MKANEDKITELSIREVVNGISRQDHAMAGATIAISAAHSAALGEACLRISRNQLSDPQAEARAGEDIAAVANSRQQLLALADEDGAAITTFAANRDQDGQLERQDYLCQTPGQIARAAISAAKRLQAFRPLVCEQVQDDLEMAIALLAGTARSALLLLDSNLRIWPRPALLEKYEPVLTDVERELGALQPLRRIRTAGNE